MASDTPSNAPEFLDQQADTLSQCGQDLIAQQVRQVAAEFRAHERRIAELEAENSALARRAAAAVHALKAA